MISQVESFLCPEKQETPEEGQRIQQPEHYASANNNNAHQASSQKFRQTI